MRKHLLFLILLLCCIGCQNDLTKLKRNDITHINVYHIPFDILSPIETTQEQIKLDLHKKVIQNSGEIEKICTELNSLEKLKDAEFIDTSIYLRADFYNGDSEVLRVLFDKNHFKIGNNLYKESSKLINTLTKD